MTVRMVMATAMGKRSLILTRTMKMTKNSFEISKIVSPKILLTSAALFKSTFVSVSVSSAAQRIFGMIPHMLVLHIKSHHIKANHVYQSTNQSNNQWIQFSIIVLLVSTGIFCSSSFEMQTQTLRLKMRWVAKKIWPRLATAFWSRLLCFWPRLATFGHVFWSLFFGYGILATICFF